MLGTLEERRGREGARVVLRRARRRQAWRRPCSSIWSTRCRPTGRRRSRRGSRRIRRRSGAEPSSLAFRDALLQGGSVGRGRETFVEHPAAQCTRCHTVRNAGSDVGPNLTGVAHPPDARADPRVAARAERAHRAGLRHGGITLKNGKRVDGTLRDETRHRRRRRRRARRRPSSGSRRRRSPSAPTRSRRCRPSGSSSSRARCGIWWRISRR